MTGHQFISYSSADALEFAFRLHEALEAGPPHVLAWLDRRDIKPGRDWDSEIVEAIRSCNSFLFVLSKDSVEDHSVCKLEWSRALSYKKPIVPIRFQKDAELPFRLGNRQFIDFTGPFDQGLAQLRNHLTWLDSPAGALQGLLDRLADANRDLRRAQPEHEARIRDDLAELEKQVEAQKRIVADPEGAKRRAEQSIERGLERERQPSRPISGISRTKFLNPPPAVAPSYFQGRHNETRRIGDFLRDHSKRLMTVIGRGGIGKTATVCRVLKAIESENLPDGGGPLEVDGIIYHSGNGSRRVNAPNLYADLLALLPPETARRVESTVKDPKASTETKMRALLDAFPIGRTVVLLDNFEDVVDPETFAITDAELSEALHALLKTSHHGVKVILTTRIAPRALNLTQPGLQVRLDLDGGLESPHAENILREMDADGKLSLKNAPPERLALARERTRGFPRALEALFAILSADRETTLEEILADASTHLPENVTEALVGDAFSRLDPVAQKVMQVLAIYGRPVPPAAIDYVLQPHQPGVDAAPVLNRLVNMHFARKEAGRYHLHPVDRKFSLSRLNPGSPSEPDAEPAFRRRGLQRQAAEYFRQARLPRKDWKTIDDLQPQLGEFDLRCETKEYDIASDILFQINSLYLNLWGWYSVVIDLNDRLLDQIGRSVVKSNLLNSQGFSYLSVGRARRAIVYHEQALEITREFRDRIGEGITLNNLGQDYTALGQIKRATRTCYDRALEIAHSSGDLLSKGLILNNLGGSYAAQGQTDRAIRCFEEALIIARNVGDRRSEAMVLGNLGGRFAELGQIERASQICEEALEIAREVGFRSGEGLLLRVLGENFATLGRTERAIESCKKALDIARIVGDQRLEGLGLSCQATTFIDEKFYENAIKIAVDVVRIGEDCEDPFIVARGSENLALGRLCIGDLYRARAAIEAGRSVSGSDQTLADKLLVTHVNQGPTKSGENSNDSEDYFWEPGNNHYMLALVGLIAVRQGDTCSAIEASWAAIYDTVVMLDRCDRNFSALDSKGLALACLVVLKEDVPVDLATASFRAAREITMAAGIVGRVRRLLDLLAPADSAGVLVEVRAAALGEDR